MTTYRTSDIISPAFADPHRAIRAGAINELVAKGGRGSCKSSFVSVELVLLLLRHPNCHAVALCKVANTLLNSVYAQICWAIAELGLTSRFRCTRNPMACTYLPTGQKIMFFGLDDPGKLKSIKVPFGYIGMGWFEELDQFDGPEQVRNVEQSIFRGGEFERGQSRIIASDDLLRRGRDGRRGLSDNIFVGIDDDPETVRPTIFSPALREQSFLARKQEYLRTAENIIGLKRGLLSEAEAAERTATEITSSAGDYNLTVIDFQQMWETAVREAVQICGILGQLYKIPGACEVEENAVSIDWGNGILYDEDKTWADYMSMVSAGMLKPEITLGWRFGMPVETEADLAAIRAKYMPTLNQLADGDG